MRAIFSGGIKSGKSTNAESYALSHAKHKPIYLATTEFFDDEMSARVETHKSRREEKFITIEEPLKIYEVIKNASSPVLVECLSMWINNMLYHGYKYDDMKRVIVDILELEKDVVFVVNDVSCSVVSENALVREFVDISGKLSQLIASKCDEVFQVSMGISVKIK